jgi:hypothetical protein
VRDDGDKLQVSREATAEGLQAALRLAMERYGERITVNGTLEFKAQIIRAAVDSQLPITFANPALERWRQELSTKEHTHKHQDDGGHVLLPGDVPRHLEQPGAQLITHRDGEFLGRSSGC